MRGNRDTFTRVVIWYAVVTVIVILTIGGFGIYKIIFSNKNIYVQGSELSKPVVSIANPASVNCLQKGGSIEIRKSKRGEYGVCLFEDNRQCEEWAFFRGQCPMGGLKITGYDNDAEIYCTITGGQVEGVGTKTPMCKRVDGTYCNAQANLDGDCPIPFDLNANAGNVEAP